MSNESKTSHEDDIELRTSMAEGGNQAANPEDEEQEIDLLELAMKLWQQRRKIAIWCLVGAVLGVVVAFSIPKEYDTSVKLVPEVAGNQKLSGSLGAMAAMVGIGGSG